MSPDSRRSLHDVQDDFFSPDDLRKIRRHCVGIVGAGGLGSNVAMLLVRSGFEHFVLIDFDVVSAGNLNRQFFFTDQIGQSKVNALRDNMLKIEPRVDVVCCVERVTAENLSALLKDCTIIVEAVDDAATKAMIVGAATAMEDMFVVSASGMAGFGNTDAMKTRYINPRLVVVGDEQTGIAPDAPPLAPRVMIAAAKEADAVLEYVLRKDKAHE